MLVSAPAARAAATDPSPALPGVDVATNDIAYDDGGTRYIVSSAELISFGWRMTLMEADA